jgi:hypothetical protein
MCPTKARALWVGYDATYTLGFKDRRLWLRMVLRMISLLDGFWTGKKREAGAINEQADYGVRLTIPIAHSI